MEATCEELGEHLVDSAQRREAAARSGTANEQAALNTLAKASSAVRRRTTPEGLLERAEKVLTDPDAMGVVASHISAGQLAKAADLLADAEARADKDDEDHAHARVESQKEHELLANVSQLGEQVADLQHSLNSLMSRLSKLEARPAAPAPAPAQTVAKGAQFGRRQVQSTDYKNTTEGLMTRLEAVVDSPGRVGHISSMIQAGQLDQARQIIEKAELAHEADVKKNARRRF